MGDRGGNAPLRVQDPVRASSYFGFRSVLTVTPGKYLRAKIGEDRDVWTSEKKCGQYVLLHKALHQQKPDGTSSKHSARLAGLCASCSGAVARWLVFTGPNLRLRGARLFQIEYRDRDYQTHVYRRRDRLRAPAFLLQWVHLESTGKSTRQSLGIGGGTADVSTKGFLPSWALHGEMGGCFCHSSWSTLVQGGAHPWESTRAPRHDRR